LGEELKQRIASLCSQAFSLVLLVRGCNDRYAFELPEIGKTLDNEDCEPFAAEEHQNSTSQVRRRGTMDVAGVIFGSLVKYAQDSMRIVLEKAHVVFRQG